MKQKLSCHSLTPGSPSWRRSRQAEQGRTQGAGVMERWALLRIDSSTTSAGCCSFWGDHQADSKRTPMSGLLGISVSLSHGVCEHLFAGQTTMAPNEEGTRVVRHQGKARAVDDD